MKFVWVAPVLLMVAACSTPLERCVDHATSEYDAHLAAISEAKGNIRRGYALHRETVPYTYPGRCHSKTLGTYTCPKTGYRTQETPVAIDVRQEKLKLAQLEKQVLPYRRAAQTGTARCRAQFPEDT